LHKTSGAKSVLTTGSVVGDFRIEREVGRGGMGVVYRATQVSLGRPVAFKVIASALADKEGFRERFVRESRLAASLDHPNVIPVYAAGDHDGVLYIAMRYVEGTDLRLLLRQEGRLDPLRAAGVIAQVASALDAAHDRGMVHRDVKPANVLVASRGGGEHVYLTDFGLTKRSASESGLTAAGEWVGTLDYVAPEQLRGESVGPPADVYALGCVLYELLSGEVPFPRENDVAKLWAHIADPAPSALEPAPSTPAALAAVAQRAMAKDPRDRFPAAGVMGRVALASVPGGADTGARARAAAAAAEPAGRGAARAVGLPAAGAPPRRRARRLLLLSVAAVLGAAAAIASVLALDEDTPAERPPASERPALASAAGRVDARIDVGDSPIGVAAGTGAVWVANTGDETVTRIDPRAGRAVGSPIPVGEDPRAIVAGGGAVWVANFGDGTVSRIDPATNRAGPPIAVGRGPTDLAVGDGRVWVATELDRVMRIDVRTGAVAGLPIRVRSNGSIAVSGDSVWTSDRKDGTVRSIDTRSNEPTDAPISIGASPADLVAGPQAVWVALADDGALRRMELRADRAGGRTVPLPGRPEHLVRAGRSLWATDVEGESVRRVEMGSGRVLGEPLAVGEDPGGLAAGAGSIWVTSTVGDTVTRIEPR
jgi:YVTN family beta-propeller protein